MKNLLKSSLATKGPVHHIQTEHGYSEWGTRRIIIASPLVSPKHTLLLSTQMLELGEDRQHFGSPCLHKLLRRKGLARKHKRAERI